MQKELLATSSISQKLKIEEPYKEWGKSLNTKTANHMAIPERTVHTFQIPSNVKTILMTSLSTI